MCLWYFILNWDQILCVEYKRVGEETIISKKLTFNYKLRVDIQRIEPQSAPQKTQNHSSELQPVQSASTILVFIKVINNA